MLGRYLPMSVGGMPVPGLPPGSAGIKPEGDDGGGSGGGTMLEPAGSDSGLQFGGGVPTLSGGMPAGSGGMPPPPGPLWLAPGALDTSQDHVRRPPAA